MLFKKVARARIKICVVELEWNSKRQSISRDYVNHLKFWDDIVLIDNTPEEVQIKCC